MMILSPSPNLATASAPQRTASAISRIGIVGAGDVTRKKYWPALQALDADLDGIAVASLESASLLDGPEHDYYPLSDDQCLPLARLYAAGYLSHETLWIIATPSPYHVRYAQILAPYARVAIEKPLASCLPVARQLLRLPQAERAIYPIDHKLFNQAVLDWVDACRITPDLLTPVCRIEATFYEADGFAPGRYAEDTLADIQWHLYVPVIAAFNAAGIAFDITVEQVDVARYVPDSQRSAPLSPVWTASRVQGHLLVGKREIAYDFRQAKAAPTNAKTIRLYDSGDALIAKVDMNETGWLAHGRVLHALMQPVVNMRHDLTDALRVMELVETCRHLACEVPAYAIGSLPAFIA